MKKYIGLIGLGLILSTQSVATTWTDANCTNRGGTIVTTNSGTKFCRSNAAMNWWRANVWCQRHGGQLASAQSVCQMAYQNNARCPNFISPVGMIEYWLSDVTGTDGQNATLCYNAADAGKMSFLKRSAAGHGAHNARAFCD